MRTKVGFETFDKCLNIFKPALKAILIQERAVLNIVGAPTPGYESEVLISEAQNRIAKKSRNEYIKLLEQNYNDSKTKKMII